MSGKVEFDLLGQAYRQDLTLDDLVRVDDMCVVFEGKRKDSDGVGYWVYTVGGRLDGQVIGSKEGGCLVGGQAIVIHARNRCEADALAFEGVRDTAMAERLLQLEAARDGIDRRRNAGMIADSQEISRRTH